MNKRSTPFSVILLGVILYSLGYYWWYHQPNLSGAKSSEHKRMMEFYDSSPEGSRAEADGLAAALIRADSATAEERFRSIMLSGRTQGLYFSTALRLFDPSYTPSANDNQGFLLCVEGLYADGYKSEAQALVDALKNASQSESAGVRLASISSPSRDARTQAPAPEESIAPSTELNQFLNRRLSTVLMPLGEPGDRPRTKIAKENMELRQGFDSQVASASDRKKPVFSNAVEVCDAVARAIEEHDKSLAKLQGSADRDQALGVRSQWQQRRVQLRQDIESSFTRLRQAEANAASEIDQR